MEKTIFLKKYTKKKYTLKPNGTLYNEDIDDDIDNYIYTLQDERRNQIKKNLKNYDSLKTKRNEFIAHLKIKFASELEGYEYVDSPKSPLILPTKCLVRYVTLDEKIRFGGMLVKREIDPETNVELFMLLNTAHRFYKINFKNYFIFTKQRKERHSKMSELMHALFIQANEESNYNT